MSIENQDATTSSSVDSVAGAATTASAPQDAVSSTSSTCMACPLSLLQALRRRQPGSPLWRVFAWYGLHFPCFVWFTFLHRFRSWHVDRVPATGPLLIVSNHQSFYDPAIVGLATHKRQFYALARASLFKNRFFAGLIHLLNAIPVDQEAADTRAMRTSVQVLKQGHALLIFPEGARTLTGKTEHFETGTWLLIKRAKPTVLPVAIEGAYDLWPRTRKLPRLRGRVGLMIGEPIAAETLLEMPAEEGLEMLRQRVEALRLDAAARLHEG